VKQKILNHFQESIRIKKKILEKNTYFSISKMGKIAAKKIEKGGKIFFCGNGGSAADAQHLAAELLVRLKPENNRKGLPAIALSLDISTLTACSNDYGFDKIFERSLESLANSEDILIAITTSGNSKNILNAVKKAKQIDVLVFGFLGANGGKVLKHCDEFFLVPSSKTGHIQESHITGGHALIECIEENLFNSGYLKKYK
jgi:D-sedoheptulose 7-phosphate isomerase